LSNIVISEPLTIPEIVKTAVLIGYKLLFWSEIVVDVWICNPRILFVLEEVTHFIRILIPNPAGDIVSPVKFAVDAVSKFPEYPDPVSRSYSIVKFPQPDPSVPQFTPNKWGRIDLNPVWPFIK